MDQTRRQFVTSLSQTVFAYSIIDFLSVQKIFAAPVEAKTSRWLQDANDLAREIKKRKITALTWQREMEHLLARIDLSDFLKYIQFDELQKQALLPSRGESFKFFALPADALLPQGAYFYRNLAGFRKDRAIPPHGHDNLVSSFMVLQGSLRGRHFDRLHDEGDYVFIKPTVDQIFTRGQFSTVSEVKDNVHWFKALENESFIFDLGVAALDPHWTAKGLTAAQLSKWKHDSTQGGPAKSDRVYLDVDQKGRTMAGDFKVARMTNEQAYATYG